MEIKKFNKVNEKVYYYKTSNNLEVYMYKDNKTNESKASFISKYGSKDNNFYSYNLGKYIEVPNGIAHFLEHKMFEYKVDPFGFFEKSGAKCNAFTSTDRTSYYFKCNKNFYKNLEFLITYVQNPNFTDENVEKEKGIIKQEIKMYQDYPEEVVFEETFKNLFHNDYMKYFIAGEVEDIEKITKEDLYECYNAFYNSNNMFLIITGNFNVKKVIETIEKANNNKDSLELKLKSFDEPDNVVNNYIEIKKDVSTPLLGFGIKIKSNKSLENDIYLKILFKHLFSNSSDFVIKLKKDNIIFDDLHYSITNSKYHDILFLEARSLKYEELIKRLKDLLVNFKIDKKSFNRIKKVLLAEFIRKLDSIDRCSYFIMDNIIKYNKIEYDYYNILKNLEYKDFDYDLSNQTITVIKN